MLTPGTVGTYLVTMQLPPQVGTGPVAQIVCIGLDYNTQELIPVTNAQ